MVVIIMKMGTFIKANSIMIRNKEKEQKFTKINPNIQAIIIIIKNMEMGNLYIIMVKFIKDNSKMV